MPCYDARSDRGDLDRDLAKANQEIKELGNYLNGYAEMICEHCTNLEASGHGHLITGHLKNWFEAHKKWDKERGAI